MMSLNHQVHVSVTLTLLPLTHQSVKLMNAQLEKNKTQWLQNILSIIVYGCKMYSICSLGVKKGYHSF